MGTEESPLGKLVEEGLVFGAKVAIAWIGQGRAKRRQDFVDRVVGCRLSGAVALADTELLNLSKNTILPHVSFHAGPQRFTDQRVAISRGNIAAEVLDHITAV